MKLLLLIALIAFATLTLAQTLPTGACPRKCFAEGAAAGPCPISGGSPAASCMCDEADEGYEAFTSAFEECINECTVTESDRAYAFIDAVCDAYEPSSTTSAMTSASSTKSVSTKSASSSVKSSSGSASSTKSVSTTASAKSTGSTSASSTASVKSSSAGSTTVSATTKSSSATSSAIAPKPTDLGEPQYFVLNSTVSDAPLYLACSETNCQLSSNGAPFRQVCASSGACPAFMLVPTGPNPQCVTVSGPTVKLSPCAANVTESMRKRQTVPTSQLWRIDPRNTIISAAASTAATGCLTPSAPAAPNTLVALGSCTGPDSSWMQSATPVTPPPQPSSGLSGGAIAGIVIGSLAGAALIAGGGYGIYKSQQRKKEGELLNKNADFPMETAAPIATATPAATTSIQSYEKEAPPSVDPIYSASAPISSAVPPASAPTGNVGTQSTSMEGLCTAVRAYNPRYADELELRPGDQVRVEESFPDVRIPFVPFAF